MIDWKSLNLTLGLLAVKGPNFESNESAMTTACTISPFWMSFISIFKKIFLFQKVLRNCNFQQLFIIVDIWRNILLPSVAIVKIAGHATATKTNVKPKFKCQKSPLVLVVGHDCLDQLRSEPRNSIQPTLLFKSPQTWRMPFFVTLFSSVILKDFYRKKLT